MPQETKYDPVTGKPVLPKKYHKITLSKREESVRKQRSSPKRERGHPQANNLAPWGDYKTLDQHPFMITFDRNQQ
jgi:hypothetical protein